MYKFVQQYRLGPITILVDRQYAEINVYSPKIRVVHSREKSDTDHIVKTAPLKSTSTVTNKEEMGATWRTRAATIATCLLWWLLPMVRPPALLL